MTGTWKYVLAAILLVVVAVAFMARPSPILGIDGSSLAASVNDGSAPVPCRETAEGTWTCTEMIDGGSSGIDYQVDVGTWGCWTGELLMKEAAPKGTESEVSGCVSIVDHLFGLI